MPKTVLFNAGRIVGTRAIADLIEEEGLDAPHLLYRHVTGDWGDLTADDKQANDDAVALGDLRILSAYQTEHGRIYIITEADRSYTTLMLAHEY